MCQGRRMTTKTQLHIEKLRTSGVTVSDIARLSGLGRRTIQRVAQGEQSMTERTADKLFAVAPLRKRR